VHWLNSEAERLTMPHDPAARRLAAAVPLVLFGEHGRTVEGYMPAEEDLSIARPPEGRNEWVPVQGPHLRAVRARDRRSKTGVIGISISRSKKTGRHWLVVNLGSTSRKFCVETMGKTEAWRRAIGLRREHLEKLALANAAIIAARLRNSAKGAA
jgi:hypothetical protein